MVASNMGIFITNSFVPERWTGITSYMDFCFSVLNCECDLKKWETFKGLVENCGWIFPFEKICIVCDRPTQLHFDSENRLHGQGTTAIEFNDGFKVWVDRGVRSTNTNSQK